MLKKIIVLFIICSLISSISYASSIPFHEGDSDRNITGKQAVLQKQEHQTSKVIKITDTALKLVGVPYKWGGITNKGFDCSGFIWYVFDKNAVHLPRTADGQYQVGKSIGFSNLQQGDLVFFTTYEPGASHSGIYLGKGNFIHTSSRRGVMVSNLTDSYWKTKYIGARRII